MGYDFNLVVQGVGGSSAVRHVLASVAYIQTITNDKTQKKGKKEKDLKRLGRFEI